jgi:hypothetical protein
LLAIWANLTKYSYHPNELDGRAMNMNARPPAIAHALKEWQVAISALTAGETVLLLRKGGIKESSGKFTIHKPQFLLYPTYEHQNPHLLKPIYAKQVNPVASSWHPETVEIGSWAAIHWAFSVSDPDVVAQLLPLHIWNELFITDRLQWKPNRPLTLLVLRVYRLVRSQVIPFDISYGGCRSWIDLKEPIAISDSQPVLGDRAFEQTAGQIDKIVRTDPTSQTLISENC